MEQLELKHVAPYLPYGLRLWHIDGECQIEMNATGSGSDCLSIEDLEMYAKPILRPLSDLFKLIDWDKNNDPYMLGYKYGIEKVTEDGKLIYAEEYYADYCASPKCYIDITSFNWWLFEYHFDIFGLIEQGLAIDINTLK